MKKFAYIISIALLGFFAASCTEQEGTVPGSDGQPKVTIYQYTPSAEYNSDEDVNIRFVKNSQTKSAKYLLELTKDKEAAIEANGEKAYVEKVLANGTDINFTDEGIFDLLLTGLANYYDITVVAVNGGKQEVSSTTFAGLAWKAGKKGTYAFGGARIKTDFGAATATTELQQCESDDKLFRFKDLYGPGKSLKFKMTDDDPVDTGTYGLIRYFRVERQATPIVDPTYGAIDVIDFGYSLGDAYFYDYGYNCYKYDDDDYCVLQVRYLVSLGALVNAYGASADIFQVD
ncbi:MAG: hypothetical protein IKZ60_04595 [Bacteroidales bacterium]|nr:hypothetical protein [Bacteroidales bacterium]